MSSNSDTALATQQSIKAYVDNQDGDVDLDFAGDSGTGSVDLELKHSQYQELQTKLKLLGQIKH